MLPSLDNVRACVLLLDSKPRIRPRFGRVNILETLTYSLDFTAGQSDSLGSGDEVESEMPERVLDLTQGLSELRLRLDRAAAITAGAQTCAERGAGQDAFKMILELDLDVLIGEAQTLLDAISMRRQDASAPG